MNNPDFIEDISKTPGLFHSFPVRRFHRGSIVRSVNYPNVDDATMGSIRYGR